MFARNECILYRFSFAVLDCGIATTFTIWCQTIVMHWIRITDGRALLVDMLGLHVVISDRDTPVIQDATEDDDTDECSND